MENMRFKVGDRVKIKSLDWFNEQFSSKYLASLFASYRKYAGRTMTISVLSSIAYYIFEEDKEANIWYDEMIECKVEEEKKETIIDYVKESNDRYRIVIDPRFDIEVDEGEYYAVRRKKEYPKTYEECCEVLSIPSYFKLKYSTYEHDYHEYTTSKELGVLQSELDTLGKLLICRNAYWKIAGEEMGLGKPWEPIFDIDNNHFVITVQHGEIETFFGYTPHDILVFPTKEMRDAFYENFKSEIEICKEFL